MKKPKPPTERSFGRVIAAALSILALTPMLHHREPRLWLLIPAAGFELFAELLPAPLRPFNLLWFKLGELLSKIMQPVVMGVFYFLVLTPIALIYRLSGNDPLRLKKPSLKSYWIYRNQGPITDFRKTF